MSSKALTTEVVVKEELRPAVMTVVDRYGDPHCMDVLVHTLMRGSHDGVMVEHGDGRLEEVFAGDGRTGLRFLDHPHSEYAWEEADE